MSRALLDKALRTLYRVEHGGKWINLKPGLCLSRASFDTWRAMKKLATKDVMAIPSHMSVAAMFHCVGYIDFAERRKFITSSAYLYGMGFPVSVCATIAQVPLARKYRRSVVHNLHLEDPRQYVPYLRSSDVLGKVVRNVRDRKSTPFVPLSDEEFIAFTNDITLLEKEKE
jgi:hypothetical protein